MDGLEKRVVLLEKQLDPPRQHAINLDHGAFLADRLEAKRRAIEAYERETGQTVGPEDQKVFLITKMISQDKEA